MSFAKLDSGIVDSTLWMQPHDVLRVWIAVLAKADATGYVRASVPSMAHLCMVPIERLEQVLAILTSPDPYSRTPDDDGRRLRKEEGGWQIVNYLAYRNARDTDAERARKREWDRENRASGHARAKPKSDDGPTQSDENRQSPTGPTQAEAEAEAEKKHSAQPSASRFVDFWQAYPRKRGKKTAAAKWKAKRLDAKAEAILADVRQRIAKDERWKRGYIPDPSTYLGQERWDDALTDPTPSVGSASPPATPSSRDPTETPLERAINRARHDLHFGQIDQAECDRRIAEATAQHRGEARA